MKKRIVISVTSALLFAGMLLPTSLTAQPTAKEWNTKVVGWNLGNQFECSAPGQDGESMAIGCPDGAIKAETAWGNPTVTKKVIKAVKEAGFNAVRIPIRWQCHITNPQAMSIDKAWLQRIKEVVGWCLDNDLKVIINTHHEKWLEGRPTYQYKEENNQKLALLWLNNRTPITRRLSTWYEPRAATTRSVISSCRPTSVTLTSVSTTVVSSCPRTLRATATTT